MLPGLTQTNCRLQELCHRDKATGGALPFAWCCITAIREAQQGHAPCDYRNQPKPGTQGVSEPMVLLLPFARPPNAPTSQPWGHSMSH